MPQEILNIIIAAVSIVVTGLATWGVNLFTQWINTKVKDKKMAELINKITCIITDAVKQIYQEFVEALKSQGKFDVIAQDQAKSKALQIIHSQLTPELSECIVNNYGNIQQWLENQIEVVLYNLKNK